MTQEEMLDDLANRIQQMQMKVRDTARRGSPNHRDIDRKVSLIMRDTNKICDVLAGSILSKQ